jgi:O-antigen ligase
MEHLTGSDWTQLIAALALGVLFFVVAYIAPPRFTVSLLIVLAPFQIIASQFGTLNIALVYLIGTAQLLRGRLRSWPLIMVFGMIFLTYMLSMSQTPPPTYFDHMLYLVGIGADIVLFYVAYNYALNSTNAQSLFRPFVVMNVLMLVYCVIQLITGYNRFAFLGVPEFELAEMSEAKQRLIGPFGAAGTNGEVFVLQILLLGYLWLHERRHLFRWLLMSIILANFALLIMTGSRGSFLTMLGSGVLFLWFFRRQLGIGRILRLSALAAAAFAVTAVIVIRYTEFNVLFERLSGTQLQEGIPDTRIEAFKLAWEHIPEKWLLGHGPQLRLIDEQNRFIAGHQFLYFPHNLYLFLLLTTGVLGLSVYLLLFWALYSWWRRARRVRSPDPFLDGLPNLAILLLIAFLVDQLKIEFLRSQFSDQQQYLFALWAILLAATATPRRSRAPVPLSSGAEVVPSYR